jgi:BCD family chlorophyll transporter-like MFS transporter
LGGALRDAVQALADRGMLGPAFAHPDAAYGVVYHIEIALLFATLIAVGPLVRYVNPSEDRRKFGLAEFPG